jgi:Protein of unknown function (DUF2637)
MRFGKHRQDQDLVPAWQREQEQRNRDLRGRAAWRHRHRQARAQRRVERKARRAASHAPGPAPGSLRIPRQAALITIAAVIAAASLTSFAESYRGLFDWAREHGLSGAWAAAWPLQLDTFIAVGELALFVALADGWRTSSRLGAWAVTLLGLAASVAGNIGHVHSRLLSDRATAAVPPLAAAAALAVGLGVLKRVVEAHHAKAGDIPVPDAVPADVIAAAKASYAATVAAGNPLSQNQLMARFGLTRAQATKVRTDTAAQANGNGTVHDPDTRPPDEVPAVT